MTTKAQLDQYAQMSMEQLLSIELNCPSQTKGGRILAIAKARTQPCSPQSLSMALTLLERYGSKWLHLIEVFSSLQFKLVFSYCINNIRTYPALIHALCKQGDGERQFMFQTNMEKAIDGEMTTDSLSAHDLWEIYILYLKEWELNLPHRTIFALERIEQRLRHKNHVYAECLSDKERIVFLHVLARIIRFHEQGFMRKLQLRKFWESIPATITFLKELLSDEGLIDKLANKLMANNTEASHSFAQKKVLQQERENIVLFFINTSEVSILQQIYLHNAQGLAKSLLMTHVIDYYRYSADKLEQLLLLQNSLIYNILSDDLPSLTQQLLTSLSLHIPNFLPLLISQCELILSYKELNEITISDIVLKLCILSRPIVQYHRQNNGEGMNVKGIIDRLVVISNSRSELIQIKTLKLMHYFREILPQNNFVHYHEIIFGIIKRVLMSSIRDNNQNQLRENNTQNSIQVQQPSLNPFTFTNNPKQLPPLYTKLSYLQCIRILEQETEKPSAPAKSEMQIRRRKFLNERVGVDLVQQNELWMCDKFLQLVSIQGYCKEQEEVFRAYVAFLDKYPGVIRRNTVGLLRVLSRQFMMECQRLMALNERSRHYQKLISTIDCMKIVAQEITEEIYIDCEECFVPVISLLKEPFTLNFQQQILSFIPVLMQKSNMITPQLNQFIIYSKEYLRKNSCSIVELQAILKEFCKPSIINSVREEWNGLVQFMTHLFIDYVTFLANQPQRIELYQKDWTQTLYLAQLLFQSYEEEYQSTNSLSEMLLVLQSQLQKLHPSQNIYQLLMTIHHINPKCKLYPFHRVESIHSYEEKYSLHMAQITMTDVLVKNIRARIFEFEQQNNEIYSFVESFVEMKRTIHEISTYKSSSLNDSLPFNKIKAEIYLKSSLEGLYKDKLIDIQQFTELKNKLLDEKYLIKGSLFEQQGEW